MCKIDLMTMVERRLCFALVRKRIRKYDCAASQNVNAAVSRGPLCHTVMLDCTVCALSASIPGSNFGAHHTRGAAQTL